MKSVLLGHTELAAHCSHITVVAGDACGGSLEGERGTFQSPGYPRKYPKHAACMWRVQTPVGTKVQLWVGGLLVLLNK